MIAPPKYKLGILREGFLYRAATILNMMEENVRNETNIENFKLGAKDWVREHIQIKPTPSRRLGERVPKT